MAKKELKVAFFLAWRSLLRGNRSSVLLNILIIGMVFTNMMFFPALMAGIGVDIKDQIISYQTSNIMIGPAKGEQYITDLDTVLAKVNGMPGVERATPHYQTGATLSYRGRLLGATVDAIQPREETYISPLYTTLIAGSYLGESDMGEAIIGSNLAGSANILPEEEFTPSLGGVRVGDSILAEYGNGVKKEYRVKGIYQTGNFEMDSRMIVSWEDMETVRGESLDYAPYITVKVKEGYSESFVKNELLQYGLREEVQTTDDLLDKGIGRALASFSIIGFISMLVSLVIAVVVLFIVVMIKTLNNRKQIGILKAIGVEKSVIMHSYGFQVILLSIAGILVGFFFTALITLYMTYYPMVTPEFSATPYVTPLDLATNGIILFAASVISGYFPAWKVSRENIRQVIRA
jgi:putative ABC transport system permease protein